MTTQQRRASTSDTDKTKAAAASPSKTDDKADEAEAAPEYEAVAWLDTPEEPSAGEAPARSDCVVNKGKGMHVGRAVPGSLVCSYHTMHYNPDGSKRGE